MKIAIIGYGKEGKANEAYFSKQRSTEVEPAEQGSDGAGRASGNEIEVIEPYKDEDYAKIDWGQYDLVLRSPSVRPQPGFSSATQYFFDHCPAPIIGVTGTKGKGTTCSMIAAMLEALGKKVFLVGNIGVPAISKLTEIQEEVAKEKTEKSEEVKNDSKNSSVLDKKHKCVVVYELSSFQLWDLTKSPQVAVVLGIAPDHLNVHRDFAEYVAAKGHIAEFQEPEDTVIYFRDNEWSREIAEKSPGKKIPYPVEDVDTSTISKLLDSLTVPGQHNREDAEAAVLAVAAYLGMEPELLIRQHFAELSKALAEFKGLPHHIEFVRELNGVSYYDDSFSTAEPALEVALKAFPGRPLVLIAGGQDKGVDLTEMKRMIFETESLEKVFLLGEIAEKLAEGEPEEKFELVKSLEEAVEKAQKVAEQIANREKQTEGQGPIEKQQNAKEREQGSTEKGPVVLLSPGAASLDMFESYYVRGDQFKELVKNLK